jgi:hypothetical protein
MVDVSTATLVTRPARPDLEGGMHPSMAIAFLVLLVGGILFTGYHLYADIRSAHVETTTWIPFLFLALALFIALGFEFVNGFHDTEGISAIKEWRSETGEKYHHTVEPLSVTERDGKTVVTAKVSGNSW